MNGTRRRLLQSVGVSLLTIVIGRSSWAGEPTSTEAAQLLERARAYWAAQLANDLLAAWPYEEISLDPNWTVQGYLKRNRVILKAAEVLEVERVEGDEATVKVRLRYDLPQVFLKDYEQVISDPWVKRNGAWYHKEVRSALFGDGKEKKGE